MMRAYNEYYLSDVKKCLATVFDFAINDCGLSPKMFCDVFIVSGYADRFEIGDPGISSGKSGIEVVREILYEVNLMDMFKEPVFKFDRTPEYFAGFYLAEYQWYSAKSYKDIFFKISLDEIISMYPLYHEMDVLHFIHDLEDKYNKISSPTKLKRLREAKNLTQTELSHMSNVNLRSIQMYEQKINDIDKAQVHTIYKLARAMRCNVEDLLENPMNVM